MAYLHNIKKYDMENTGTKGASVSLWFNGCSHKCKGCWNEQTWERDFSLERENSEVIKEVLESLNGPMKLNTLALLGGDPLFPSNLDDTIEIVSSIKKQDPEIEIICWTGFTWEQVNRNKRLKEVLPFIDILIDGRFIQERKITGMKYGSDNQRCIDVKASLDKEEIVLMKGF